LEESLEEEEEEEEEEEVLARFGEKERINDAVAGNKRKINSRTTMPPLVFANPWCLSLKIG
jgi:hypothetical protein